jgi:glucose-1-phosphate cytidylyltransferase
MKVVLFCGGLGTRLRDYSETIPKPLVPIGYRPILWHVMRYYAHYGHNDFILCLGYRADTIKQYFLKYDETISNDFVLTAGGRKIELLASDIQDWKITFVDTGMTANVGMRLKAVQPLLRGEKMFLANYADGVTDLALPSMIEGFRRSDAVATFVTVPPNLSFHMVQMRPDGHVNSIQHISEAGMRINGGYFVLRPEIFDWIETGDDLVEAPFRRLAAAGKLVAHPHDGFWACMDTFKDKQRLEDLYASGQAPWEVWKPGPPQASGLPAPASSAPAANGVGG